MSTIALKNLSKHFGDLVAVNNIDLDVGAGEVVCLLGPSGCGKTTTLRMVAGLESASSGEVLIAGESVNHLPPRQRNVAMVFQFYALYPTLSVRENLLYPLHAEAVSEAEKAERADRILQVLQLSDVQHRIPGRLSEGEKQRVAVGRAIIRDPQCFLFDEPLSRLDVQLRESMRGQIKELLSGLSKATVIVTHDQLEALTMADRIAVMRDGVIEQFDSPHEVFTIPRNLFVAGFIGTPQMNLLPITITECTDNALGFDLGGQRVTLPVSAVPANMSAGARFTLGVRPRSLSPRSASSAETFSGRVDLVEPMGAETLLHLSSAEQEIRVVLPRRDAVAEGGTMHLSIDAARFHLFDEQGQRVRL